jgi:hypothetical protein
MMALLVGRINDFTSRPGELRQADYLLAESLAHSLRKAKPDLLTA